MARTYRRDTKGQFAGGGGGGAGRRGGVRPSGSLVSRQRAKLEQARRSKQFAGKSEKNASARAAYKNAFSKARSAKRQVREIAAIPPTRRGTTLSKGVSKKQGEKYLAAVKRSSRTQSAQLTRVAKRLSGKTDANYGKKKTPSKSTKKRSGSSRRRRRS